MGEETKEQIEELPEEKSEIDILKEQVDEFKNKYLRALADFDNFKKRSAIELDTLVQFGNENLIKEILPALDSFERALHAHDKAKKDDFLKGMSLVKRQLEDSLKKFGLEEVKSIGLPFDPNLHEAIMQKESDKPENTVLEEMQKGYTLKGRLIRPAMVIVAKKSEILNPKS